MPSVSIKIVGLKMSCISSFRTKDRKQIISPDTGTWMAQGDGAALWRAPTPQLSQQKKTFYIG